MLPPKRKGFYTAEEVVRARDDLTLFCDMCNVFFNVSYLFFCAKFKCDFENYFYYSRSSSRSKGQFQGQAR